MMTSPLTRARVLTAASLVTATLAAGGIASVLATTTTPASASEPQPAPGASDDTTPPGRAQGRQQRQQGRQGRQRQQQASPSFAAVPRPQPGNGSPPSTATRGS